MNNIRGQIAEFIRKYGSSWNNEEIDSVADSILALVDKEYKNQPSGMEAVDKDGNVRDLSILEAIEIAKEKVKWHDTYLPSGEIVRLKKTE